MMQVVPKWKVVVTFQSREPITLWIHDTCIVNVLRKVADLQFTENGLEQPTRITIG